MKPVNENSACVATARYYARSGAETTPTTIRWRLKDVTNDRLLQDWEALAVTGVSSEIPIAASLNVIYDDRHSYQDQAVSVQVDTDLSTQMTEEIIYKVKNLKAFK